MIKRITDKDTSKAKKIKKEAEEIFKKYNIGFGDKKNHNETHNFKLPSLYKEKEHKTNSSNDSLKHIEVYNA